jgi:hypothetical protein
MPPQSVGVRDRRLPFELDDTKKGVRETVSTGVSWMSLSMY